MAIGNMYSSSPEDYERIKKFAHRYRLSNIEQKVKVIREAPGYSYIDPYRYDSFDAISFKETHMAYFSMEISERDLVSVVNRLNEFDDLLSDPETAHMLQEARFLYRLKHGTTF